MLSLKYNVASLIITIITLPLKFKLFFLKKYEPWTIDSLYHK